MMNANVLYHWADIKSNSCEVTGEHSEEIKAVTQTVDISAKHLLSIATCHFGLKEWNLVQANITSFSNLNVLVMGDISSPQSWVETWKQYIKSVVSNSTNW
jgi:hypothetical protein